MRSAEQDVERNAAPTDGNDYPGFPPPAPSAMVSMEDVQGELGALHGAILMLKAEVRNLRERLAMAHHALEQAQQKAKD